MITIERPFLFGSNSGQFKIIANDEEICEIVPQGKRTIKLDEGRYDFVVKSKRFKSLTTNIEIADGDSLIIGNPQRWILIAFLLGLFIPDIFYYTLDFEKNTFSFRML